MTDRERRKDALAIWKEGVRAVHAGDLVERAVRVRGNTLFIRDSKISLSRVNRIVVVGAGKAGKAMAQALETALGSKLLAAKQGEGWVNVPDAQGGELRHTVLHGARSSHDNMPTRAGARGSARMLKMIRGLGSRDLVICLISGGGSALWPSPPRGIRISDKVAVTRQLHAAGATINEMNTVRKHLSVIKGGGLIRETPARILSLVVSDVVGDPLDVIASGPTAPDPTTYADAVEVLKMHGLTRRAPRRVMDHLWEGVRGEHPETWKRRSSRVSNFVIGNNAGAMTAAAREARRRGYRVLDLSSYLEGESRELGATLAAMARGVRDQGTPVSPPACLLSGGETTVTLGKGHGLGGRNQELVLGALAHLQETGMKNITILSGGTDGEDGPTDAAGAVADAPLLRRARERGISPDGFLHRHDAYRFFDAVDGLIRVGPTHTNVMDLRVVLVG